MKSNDDVLAPLIRARDDGARAAALESLVHRAAVIVDGVLSRYRSSISDLDDVRAIVMMRLVRRLNDVPHDEDAAISSFDDFAAMLAFNAATDALRARFPARARLKNRIRYVLTHSRRVAMWRSGSSIAAGLTAWRGAEPLAAKSHSLNIANDDIEHALILLFTAARGPLLLEDAVDTIAAALGVAEPERVSLENEPSRSSGAEESLERRSELAVIWEEIRELREGQRAALLLNLRDNEGVGAIELFVLLGVATIDEIAASLAMTADDLASIWNSLPLDDQKIAARLGITRQQVINLRRAARDRLVRRMSTRENSSPPGIRSGPERL